MSEPFNLAKFNNQINNPDEDYTIIAFDELKNYLSNVEEFDLPPDSIRLCFLHPVIDRITDKTPDISTLVFRIIVLLAEKLPVCTIKDYFEAIFEVVYDIECQVRTQTLSVLREVLSNSVSFSTERQDTLVKNLIPRLEREIKQNQNVDILVFTLELLTSLTEFLGFHFDQQNLELIFEIIKNLASNCVLDLLPSVASLTKIWMTHAFPEQFDGMIHFLFKLGEESTSAFTILSSMVCYKPIIYKKFSQEIISLFIQQIDKEEEEVTQLLEEKPETDIFYDTQYIPHITEYVSSLASLTKAFPDQNDDETVDNFIGIAFKYLTYGSNNVGEEIAADEDDFIMEGDEDVDDDMKLDDVDDEVITGDDSWKIRKTAMTFSTILIQFYSAKFYESLSYVNEEEEINCLAVVDTLLRDSDTGAQKDAFAFLKTVVQYYKDELAEETINSWYSTLNTQLVPSKQAISGLVLETIGSVLNKCRTIPLNLLTEILAAIPPILNTSTIPAALELFNVIFSTTQSSSEIITHIALMIADIVKQNRVIAAVPYLPTSSRLFIYSQSCTLSNDAINAIEDLAQAIITLSKSDQSEKVSLAFEALGVFSVTCNTSLVGTAIESIVNALNNDIALRPITRAIALIAASPAFDRLSNYFDTIYEKLCSLFENVDGTLVFFSLWTICLLAKKGAVNSNAIERSSSSLINIITSGDPKNKLLSLKVLQLVPGGATNALNSIKNAFTVKLSDDVIAEAAKFINVCAETNIEKVRFTITELSNSNPMPEISAEIASVIGYPAGMHPEIGNELLAKFEKTIIGNKDSVSPFVLQCVGEIGTLIDLGNHTELVDAIFALISHTDRMIFNAAAECIGLMSVGSIHVVLKRLLEQASTDNDHLAVWTLATLSMTKRFAVMEGSFNKLGSSYKQITEFLITNADFSKPTELSTAQCFSNLIKINENFLSELLSIAATSDIAGPVASHAISLFFDDSGNKTIMRLIPTVMQGFDLNKPRISQYIIQCLKTAIQRPKNVKSLVSYVPQICDAVSFNKDIHLITEAYGFKQVQVDIGEPLRFNAIECLLFIFKTSPTAIPVPTLIKAVRDATQVPEEIKEDKNRIIGKGCELLSLMAISRQVEEALIEKLKEAVDILKESERYIFDSTLAHTVENEELIFRLIACLRKLTEKQRINDIEQLYAKYKADPRIKKIESDLSYSVDQQEIASSVSSGSASFSLMESFNPEASVIFTL
ncbi:hypothetical protein TRFO_00966 [Tritrichomonas foetus]|uniref:TATA-binding protein interacting (TIP20) domain-containing protein n=1 Tax=Tritrichomonas foetus TaxID=1144522 RepID=A0A1J4L6N3_9EUKA|nr:hypothetical protein TRFO_00966 [Tritrichomonas foetus]|eukprot:OHT17668.1 hypothetical protein TRFO_00966 [Tritrichomonas foetus]